MSKKNERANKLTYLYAVLSRAPVDENGECTFELDDVSLMMVLVKEVLALDGIHQS
jgi:hypothetical protein